MLSTDYDFASVDVNRGHVTMCFICYGASKRKAVMLIEDH